jgi:Fur family ferric uptake transcriptional regulator
MIASTQTNSPLAGHGSPPEARAGTRFDLATARMKAGGLRVTQPRMAILSALCRQEQPVTIEQLHADVGAETCDLVTVYRCVAAFERIGLVARAFFHNGTALYRIELGQAERYHVICKTTNRVEELDAESAADLRRAIEAIEGRLRSRGYADVGHLVEFFGVSAAGSRLAGRRGQEPSPLAAHASGTD